MGRSLGGDLRSLGPLHVGVRLRARVGRVDLLAVVDGVIGLAIDLVVAGTAIDVVGEGVALDVDGVVVVPTVDLVGADPVDYVVWVELPALSSEVR
jgi:hypothetical protein